MAMLALSSSLTTAPISARHSSPRVRRNSSSVSFALAGSRTVAPTPNLNLGADHGFFTGRTLRLPASCSEGVRTERKTDAWRGVAPRASLNPAANEGMKSLWVAVGIPLVLGVVDSIFNSPGTKWYFDLRKPKWQPPSFLFGGAWSVLYPLMGLASWLVWAEGGWAKQAYPLTLYAIQLALNLAWPALFFGARKIGAAFVDICLLDVALIATIVAFRPVNEVAANLLTPYLAWVLFATVLNYALWELNKTAGNTNSPPPAPAT